MVVSLVSKNYSLNRIKSKTVGDGQHGTARWATLKEIGKTYTNVQELTPHILNELIEKIVVHEREIGEDGVKTQQVDIYCKFIGCVDIRRAKADHAEIIKAEQAGYTVVGIAAEYGSGVTLDRLALQEVTEAVLAGRVDVVLVNSFDRLGRDRSMTKQYIDLLTEHKVKLHCVREQMIIDSEDFLPLERFCAKPSEGCKERGMCCQVR